MSLGMPNISITKVPPELPDDESLEMTREFLHQNHRFWQTRVSGGQGQTKNSECLALAWASLL